MKELELFRKMAKVKAPEDFEREVLAALPGRKTERVRSLRFHRFAYAGAAAVLGTFVLINVLIPRKAGNGGTGTAANEIIPVMETLDYSNDIYNASYESQDIHILEQVSDEASPAEIFY